MKKKTSRRLNLNKETLQHLDEPLPDWVAAAGGRSPSGCNLSTTMLRPTLEGCTVGGTGETGPKPY